MKTAILFLPSLLVSLLALSAIVPNGLVFVRHFLRRETDVPSVIPVVGGFLGFLAVFLFPKIGFKYLCLAPLVLDWGCISIVISIWKSLTGTIRV